MVFKNIKIEWSVFFSISFFMLRTPEFKKKNKSSGFHLILLD